MRVKGMSSRMEPFPALVGNKRMHGRCGCKLVITSQEIALLLLPDSEDEGTPARWRRSSNILTPSHLAGVRGQEQSYKYFEAPIMTVTFAMV